MNGRRSLRVCIGCGFLPFAAAAILAGCTSSANPGPMITGLNPPSTMAGGPAFTLQVMGTGFLNTDVVLWNGSALATTPVSSNELDALVPASLIQNAGPIAARGRSAGAARSSAGGAVSRASDATVSVTVFRKPPGSEESNTETFTITPSGPIPAFTITKTHSGTLTAGGTVAYTITVTDSGTAPTTGMVTVMDTPSSGLTIATASGSGWTCVITPATSCTTMASAGIGTSFPAITVTAVIGTVTSVTNTATVSGGGATQQPTAMDTATVVPAATPAWTITKTHAGTFTQGGTGMYTITVTNSGTAATSGTVTVSDSLPMGLMVGSASGTGWACSAGGPTVTSFTCTRSDSLAPSTGYQPITLIVVIATNAPASVTNTVSVSGGGVSTPASGMDTATVSSGAAGGLFITRVFSPASAPGFGDINVIVKFGNNGATPISNVSIAITGLPSSSTSAIAIVLVGAAGSCTITNLTCTLSGPLAPGTDPLVILTFQAVPGSGTVGGMATVSAPGASSANSNFMTSILNCTAGLGVLCGQYVFFEQGFKQIAPAIAGPVTIVGTFTADGMGNITGGIFDYADFLAVDTGNSILAGSTYTFDASGLGNLNFVNSLGITLVYKFALDPAAGTNGSLIEFEPSGAIALNGVPSGGSGFLQLQAPDFFVTQLTGNYGFSAIGGLGSPSTGTRVGMVGAITANGTCGLSATGATGTINSGGTLSRGTNFSGSLPGTPNCFVAAANGQGSAQFTSITGTPAPSFSTVNFHYYIVDTNPDGTVNHMVFISTDSPSGTQPVLSGMITSQHNGPYSTNAALDCAFAPAANLGCVFAHAGATGGNSATGNSYVLAGLASVTTQSNSVGAFSIMRDENNGGTVNSGTITASYKYNSDGTGSFTPTAGEVMDFVLTDIDTGFLLSEGTNVSSGIFGAESTPNGPFNTSGLASKKFQAGTQFLGTSAANNSVALSTVAQVPVGTNTGTFSGNTASWTSGTLQTTAVLSGSYTVGITTRVTGSTNLPGAASFAAYQFSTNKFVMVGTTSSDTAAVLLVF